MFDSGQGECVAPDFQLTDEVRLESTPGHSPGHVSVRITSRGEHAVVTGDVLHHPCQLARPRWASPFDFDKAAALQTRLDFLARYGDAPVLVFGSHFATPAAGRIVRTETRGDWLSRCLRQVPGAWRGIPDLASGPEPRPSGWSS